MKATAVLAAVALVGPSEGFVANSVPNVCARCTTELDATSSRRDVLSSVSSGLLGVTLLSTAAASPAQAKVEGYAPPIQEQGTG